MATEAPRSRWLDALDDQELLNTLLNADPALRENMREMGFVKLVPFQLDHNGATEAQYVFTDYGRREVEQRYVGLLDYSRKQRP